MMSWFKKQFENVPDHILVIKAQKGDREAFGKLYQKYLDSIYRYIYFRVNNNQEEAEDIAEVVFFRAWERLSTYKEQGIGFRPWLYRIAHNAVIDHYKQKKSTTQLNEDLTDGRDDLEEKLSKKAQTQQLMKAMHKLTDEQKQVITLRFIDDVPIREISIIMDKKEEAIRALQYRALKELKKHFEHYG